MAITLKALPPRGSSKSGNLPKNRDCECGCGAKVALRFAQGHDSRLRGFVLRVLEGTMSLSDIREQYSAGEAKAVGKAVSERKLAAIRWEKFVKPEAKAPRVRKSEAVIETAKESSTESK
jgi:hypothetical protein